MKLPIFVFVRNPINKNRFVMVWKGYHNVNIIGIFTSVCTLFITKLDIFRLGYVLSHSIGLEFIHVDSFLASMPILHHLKNTRTPKSFWCFIGGTK